MTRASLHGHSGSQLEQLADALEGLYDVYAPEGVGVWLKGSHRLLDGRSAIQAIREGDVFEVAAVVEQLRTGAFS